MRDGEKYRGGENVVQSDGKVTDASLIDSLLRRMAKKLEGTHRVRTHAVLLLSVKCALS